MTVLCESVALPPCKRLEARHESAFIQAANILAEGIRSLGPVQKVQI